MAQLGNGTSEDSAIESAKRLSKHGRAQGRSSTRLLEPFSLTSTRWSRAGWDTSSRCAVTRGPAGYLNLGARPGRGDRDARDASTPKPL